MTGLGDTLRVARERRGETLDACAAATGIDPAQLGALEAGRLGDIPPGVDAADLVARCARHLDLDPARLAAELQVLEAHDPDADTQPIPVVQPPRRDSALLWVGAGALLGVGALAVLAGGLRSDPPGPTAATPTTVSTAQPPRTSTTTASSEPSAPEPLRPVPATAPAIDLRLGARAGKTVWVEVRRGGVSGAQVFAGIVGDGASRRVASATPLWLGVAWTPNLTVSVNGEVIDAEGGTESYLVTQRGLKRLTTR